MMEYTNVPYPRDTPLFPKNTSVTDYLHKYARELEERGIMRYNQSVFKVRYRQKNYEKQWEIMFQRTGKKKEATEVEFFDAVVVALGTFTQARVPNVFKLCRLDYDYGRRNGADDGKLRVMHSKQYRNTEEIENKVSRAISSTRKAEVWS